MKNSNNYHIPEDVFSKSMIDFNIGNVAKRYCNKFSKKHKIVKSYWLANNGKTFVTNLILDIYFK